ncbi:Peptidyl-tRNA hydrolase ArfB [Botrimarina hoheduenensis]|uniref:Peptidyl-tRNA hydrolase ArfB n=1 Tax=Botrimarina hoheduenensis TaxID=2528000 RepID=A0A5C5WG83_9BACT|nr:alternative ribosome rescue aminoacyl-tRNA hydrolase ArfB [Botrimarina hoheduenensis]TWT48792.1 Peptidyl-tRNA hydrolase ArfB [Botrimarina hoheduenensis]
MADTLVVNDRIVIPKSELLFSFARSSGPGGQNVNKLNTKAVLRWKPADSLGLPEAVLLRLTVQCRTRINEAGELMITSDRYREQGRNIADCLERLRALLLAAADPPKRRRPTRKPRRANEARLKTKRQRSEVKSQRRKPLGGE